jgi:putative phosphoesterase
VTLVGIVSDTHDHRVRARAAVELFNRLGAETVIHCGDFVSQFTLAEFGRLSGRLVGVFGNNDGDRQALFARAREFGFELHDGPWVFELAGRRFSVSHEPAAAPTDCDFVIHGHTHRPRYEQREPVVINPGEACGWLTGRSTIATLDPASGAVEFHELA